MTTSGLPFAISPTLLHTSSSSCLPPLHGAYTPTTSIRRPDPSSRSTTLTARPGTLSLPVTFSTFTIISSLHITSTPPCPPCGATPSLPHPWLLSSPRIASISSPPRCVSVSTTTSAPPAVTLLIMRCASSVGRAFPSVPLPHVSCIATPRGFLACILNPAVLYVTNHLARASSSCCSLPSSPSPSSPACVCMSTAVRASPSSCAPSPPCAPSSSLRSLSSLVSAVRASLSSPPSSSLPRRASSCALAFPASSQCRHLHSRLSHASLRFIRGGPASTFHARPIASPSAALRCLPSSRSCCTRCCRSSCFVFPCARFSLRRAVPSSIPACVPIAVVTAARSFIMYVLPCCSALRGVTFPNHSVSPLYISLSPVMYAFSYHFPAAATTPFFLSILLPSSSPSLCPLPLASRSILFTSPYMYVSPLSPSGVAAVLFAATIACVALTIPMLLYAARASASRASRCTSAAPTRIPSLTIASRAQPCLLASSCTHICVTNMIRPSLPPSCSSSVPDPTSHIMPPASAAPSPSSRPPCAVVLAPASPCAASAVPFPFDATASQYLLPYAHSSSLCSADPQSPSPPIFFHFSPASPPACRNDRITPLWSTLTLFFTLLPFPSFSPRASFAICMYGAPAADPSIVTALPFPLSTIISLSTPALSRFPSSSLLISSPVYLPIISSLLKSFHAYRPISPRADVPLSAADSATTTHLSLTPLFVRCFHTSVTSPPISPIALVPIGRSVLCRTSSILYVSHTHTPSAPLLTALSLLCSPLIILLSRVVSCLPRRPALSPSALLRAHARPPLALSTRSPAG